MQQQQEHFKRQYSELTDKFQHLRKEYDTIEEQLFEKDEISRQYEEDL